MLVSVSRTASPPQPRKGKEQECALTRVRCAGSKATSAGRKSCSSCHSVLLFGGSPLCGCLRLAREAAVLPAHHQG